MGLNEEENVENSRNRKNLVENEKGLRKFSYLAIPRVRDLMRAQTKQNKAIVYEA